MVARTLGGSRLDNDIKYELAEGLADGRYPISKFGHNELVATTYEPIASGGVYRTPKASQAVQLRIKAGGDAGDDAAGLGAREVTVQGLDQTGALVTEAIATNGALASLNTSATFMRMFRMWVSKSGVYGAVDQASHIADIVIEDAGGTEDWGTIRLNGYGLGQSTICAYTVPLGHTAYKEFINAHVEGNKTVDIIFLTRESILDESPPYKAMRVLQRWIGLQDEMEETPPVPDEIPELTDIIMMAKSAQAAEVSACFRLVLVEDGK